MQNYFTTKNLIIAAAIIIIIGGGLIFYLTRSATNPDPQNESPGFFSRFFPESENKEQNLEEGTLFDNNPEAGLPDESLAPSLSKQLVAERISGAVFAKDKIRYMERASGHVFEINPDGSGKNRISNTTIPGVFEALWSKNGARAILKYLTGDNLSIMSAGVVSSTTQGIFLSPDIKDIIFSPSGNRIGYVMPSGSDTVITTATVDNKSQRAVFRIPFSLWKISWPEENSIFIANAPSAFLDGFLYRINLSTGGYEKIIGPRLGLMFSTDGKNMIFSESNREARTITSYIMNISTREARQIDLKIIPEKCVWSVKERNTSFCAVAAPFFGAIYPDDWYKGKAFFSDIIAKINTENLSASYLNTPDEVDIINPFLDPEEKNLFFTNKRDGSLWKSALE